MQYRYEEEPFQQPGKTKFGRTYFRDSSGQPWEYKCGNVTNTEDYWFIGHPQDVLSRMGITCEKKRAEELADLIDGNLDGFYYVRAACPDGSDEGIKWIMGALAQTLKERGLSFEKASAVLPARFLGTFVNEIVRGRIDRTVARDIFAALLKEPLYVTRFGTEMVVEGDESVPGGVAALRATARAIPVAALAKAVLEDAADLKALQCAHGSDLTEAMVIHAVAYSIARDEMGWEQIEMRDPHGLIATLIADPRFAVADTSVLDGLIDGVIAANPDKAAEAKIKPQLAQWFVGQTMKAAKGQKLPAPEVLAKIKLKLGVE